MKIAHFLLIALAFLPLLSWADTTRCYSIRHADLKHYCLADVAQQKSRCYSIRDNDMKNHCLAEVGQERSRCYSIKDHDRKQRCLAGF